MNNPVDQPKVSELDEKAVEAACASYSPTLFHQDRHVAHRAASPHTIHHAREAVRGFLSNAIRAYLAAFPRPQATTVGVKALEWTAILPKLWGVDTALSSYRLHEHSDGQFGVSLDGDSLNVICTSLDEAKAAAQADYDARIRSALVLT